MESKIIERFQFIPVMEPADLNGGATTGDYVKVNNAKRVGVLVILGDGTAGDANDLDLLLYQATDTSGTSAKVLNALETGRIYTMYAASLAAMQALTAITKVTQATPDEQYTPTDDGESVGIIWVEINPQDLDVDNGFDCIRCDLTQPGAAKICAAVYVIELNNPMAPELQALQF